MVIEARVDLGPLDRVLNALRKPDLRPAWNEAKKPLRADIADHRNRQKGPDGSWAPRASSTRLRSAGKRRGRPRKILGKLPTALITKSDRRKIAMASRVPWSEVQRSGGTVGHGARIPARNFLYASENVLWVIAGIIGRHLKKIWDR